MTILLLVSAFAGPVLAAYWHHRARHAEATVRVQRDLISQRAAQARQLKVIRGGIA